MKIERGRRRIAGSRLGLAALLSLTVRAWGAPVDQGMARPSGKDIAMAMRGGLEATCADMGMFLAARVVEAFEALLAKGAEAPISAAAGPYPAPYPNEYAGTYRCSQYAHRSFQKIATLAAPELIVISASPEGRLVFSSNVTSDRPGETGLAHQSGDRFEREDGGGPASFFAITFTE